MFKQVKGWLPLVALAVVTLGGLLAFSWFSWRSAPVEEIAGYRTLSAEDLTGTMCSVATSQAGGFVILWEMFGTPTPTPTREGVVRMAGYFSTATPTPVGSPAAENPPVRVAERPASGDPANGEQLFKGAGTCNLCHTTEGSTVLVGPSLADIAVNGGARVPNQSAEAYIRSVILDPDKVVSEQPKPGIMPRTFGQLLTAQQIDDLVAYLLTLD